MAGTITSYNGSTQIWNLNDNLIDTSNLVALEIQVLETKKSPLTTTQTNLKSQQSVYNAFQSDLSSFVSFMKDMSSFTGGSKAASVSQTGYVTATASSTAVSGTYDVTVSQLASRHQIAGKTITDLNAAILSSTGLTSATITFNEGTTNEKDITITSSTTYKQLIDQVNADSSYGATMYTVGGRLFLSSTQTGADGAIKLSGDSTVLATQLGLTDATTGAYSKPITEAVDAKYTINGGAELTSSSNTIKDMIPGVTLKLENITPTSTTTDDSGNTVTTSTPIKITVDNDTDNAAIEKIKSMVTSFNSAASALADYTAEGTLMQGSSIGLATGRALSKMSMFEQSGKSLYQYGIEVDKTGQLSIDTTKLEEAFNNDPDAAKAFFFGSTGLAKTMNTELSNIFGETGTLTTTLTSLKDQLADISDKLSAIDTENEAKQEAIVAKYALFEQQMSALSSQLEYVKALTGSDDDD